MIDQLASYVGRQEGWDSPDPTVVPRRLNNPGDIDYAAQLGATPVQVGKHTFAKWPTPQQGIVGLYRQLLADIAKGWSLRQLITSGAANGEQRSRLPRERGRRLQHRERRSAVVDVHGVDLIPAVPSRPCPKPGCPNLNCAAHTSSRIYDQARRPLGGGKSDFWKSILPIRFLNCRILRGAGAKVHRRGPVLTLPSRPKGAN
jgi:hypothetical protein